MSDDMGVVLLGAKKPRMDCDPNDLEHHRTRQRRRHWDV